MPISGLLVQTAPDQTARLRKRIEAIAGCQVHQTEARSGKVVVTVETEVEAELHQIFEQLRALQGVLNLALVMHHDDREAQVEGGHGLDDQPA